VRQPLGRPSCGRAINAEIADLQRALNTYPAKAVRIRQRIEALTTLRDAHAATQTAPAEACAVELSDFRRAPMRLAWLPHEPAGGSR
jgi:hypothetical protein